MSKLKFSFGNECFPRKVLSVYRTLELNFYLDKMQIIVRYI